MKKLLAIATVALISLTSTAAMATERFELGTHYVSITPEQPTSVAEGKVEVIEFFWYGCPHCYEFEPHLNKWKKALPANVEFKRIPAIFNKGWVIHAKAYFTAEMLGILDKVHQPIFDAIHKEKKTLDSAEAIATLMAEHSGMAKEKILNSLNSFAIETKSRKAIQTARLHGLRGVPAVSINGKYSTSGRYAGNYDNMIEVMNFLIRKESK